MRARGLLPSLALCAACSSRPASNGPATCIDRELIVATSDYTSSALVVISASAPPTVTTGADLGADLQLSSDGRFMLARREDLVFPLDPCGAPLGRTSVHELAPPRAPANPHDAAEAADGTVFVTIFATPKIAWLQGGRVAGTIDTSAYDPDGNPQANSIRIVGEKAFVTLERLDDADRQLLSKQPSSMLRIDVASRTVEAVIPLAGWNPFGPMTAYGDAFYLAEPRNFDVADEPFAGIERFDTKTSTTRLLATEKDLGGSVVEVAVTAGCGVAILAAPVKDLNPTSLVTFDPDTGAVGAVLVSPTPGFDLQGLAWRGNTLFVGDRRANANGYPLHVYDREPNTCTLRESTRKIALPQPPVALRTTP